MIEETPIQTKEQHYSNIEIQNSSENIILRAVCDTLNAETGERISQTFGNAGVMLNQGVKIDPETLQLNQDTGIPALSYILALTPRQLGMDSLDSPVWPALAGIIDRIMERNGFYQ